MKRFKELKEKVEKPTGDLKDACWKGYTAVGMKMKNGRKVPNCVPVKEAKEETPPFDKPYRKEEPTTTDKSGAKHSPYSKVRHLARMAAQKQMDKLKKPVKEDVGHLEEGRASQRHPLEGHDYHKKSDAELKYIAKDAHEAAEAMKGHNEKAENKYRDQANDSATVRYWRQKNGMPDWYKKKYGHIKEETEQVQEQKEDDTEEKNEMVVSQLHFMEYACREIIDYIKMGGEVEEWYQVKVAKAFSEFESLHAFMEGEKRRKGMVKEDIKQIDELTNKALADYKKAAGAQASAADKAGDIKKANKRFSGIMKATLKQFKNDERKQQKEEVEIDEQHREEGRFKPVVPKKVPNVSVTNSSKKAEIVRSAAKKTAVVADKFQPNPELNTSLTKNV